MTIDSLLERTEVLGFGDDADAVFAQLISAYTGSDRMASAIERWLLEHPSQNIQIIHWNENNASGAPVGEGRVRINFEFPPRLVYIDMNGNVVQCDFLTILVHELGHAIGGWFDTPTPSDTMGDNVKNVNKWFEQLGIPQNVSYISQDIIGIGSDILISGVSYTNGERIVGAITGQYFNDIDVKAEGGSGSYLPNYSDTCNNPLIDSSSQP